MRKVKCGKEGKMPRWRVPASYVEQRASVIRAKLMQRHAADILENPRIYSSACDAATIEWIHCCFYPASCVRIYEARAPLTFSTKIPNHRIFWTWIFDDENGNLRVVRGILSRDGHGVNERRVSRVIRKLVIPRGFSVFLFDDCASDSKGLANLIPRYAPVSE